MAPLIWAVIGLALIVSEFVVPEFVIFFFGVGALLNSLLVALIPGLAASIPLQVLIWLGMSSLSLFGLRRTFWRWLKGRRFSDQEGIDSVGKSAKVIEAITPDVPGRIRFGGTTWKAESYTESFAPGDRVEILVRDGMSFVVTESISAASVLEESGTPGGVTSEDSGDGSEIAGESDGDRRSEDERPG